MANRPIRGHNRLPRDRHSPTLLRSIRLLPRRFQVAYLALLAVRSSLGILDIVGLGALTLLLTLMAGDPPQLPFGLGGSHVSNLTFREDGLLLLIVTACGFVGKSVLLSATVYLLTALLWRIERWGSLTISTLVFDPIKFDERDLSLEELNWALGGSLSSAFTHRLMSFATVVSEAFATSILMTYFFFLDVQLATVFSLYFLGVLITYHLSVTRLVRKVAADIASGNVETTGRVKELSAVFREAKVANVLPFFTAKFIYSRVKLAQALATREWLNSMPRLVLEFALFLGLTLLLSTLVLSPPEGAVLTSLSVLIVGALRVLGGLVPLQRATIDSLTERAGAELAIHLLQEATDSHRPSEMFEQNAGKGTSPEVAVDFTAVRYRYPQSDSDALADVNFQIKCGDFVAIAGPSGAGKSTILDLVLGFRAPSSGSVHVFGRDATALANEGSGKLGLVPQKPALFAGSIRDNIVFGFGAPSSSRMEYALEMSGLTGLVASLPQGLDTPLGNYQDRFSGGQLQRMSLARSLYRQPELLILDEPTSSLDYETELDIFRRLAADRLIKTKVVISHSSVSYSLVDRIILISDGRVADLGTSKELKDRNENF